MNLKAAEKKTRAICETRNFEITLKTQRSYQQPHYRIFIFHFSQASHNALAPLSMTLKIYFTRRLVARLWFSTRSSRYSVATLVHQSRQQPRLIL